jgi:hypothetical protein
LTSRGDGPADSRGQDDFHDLECDMSDARVSLRADDGAHAIALDWLVGAALLDGLLRRALRDAFDDLMQARSRRPYRIVDRAPDPGT